jgi:hypothetical protein
MSLSLEPEYACLMSDTRLQAGELGRHVNAEKKVAHSSGAASSHFSPFYFNPTFEGLKLTCLRYKEGNRKYENSGTVWAEANWLKAFKARDVQFFRDRAGHCLEHLIDEMRGKDDLDPGGNLGAIGWFQDAMAFVKKYDPFFYGAIQGKWAIDDSKKEKELFPPREIPYLLANENPHATSNAKTDI